MLDLTPSLTCCSVELEAVSLTAQLTGMTPLLDPGTLMLAGTPGGSNTSTVALPLNGPQPAALQARAVNEPDPNGTDLSINDVHDLKSEAGSQC